VGRLSDPSRLPGVLALASLLHLVRRARRRRFGAGAALARERARFYRDAWDDAARFLGASAEPLEGDLLELRRGDARVRVRMNYTPLDDPMTLRVAGDKALTARLLREAGVPTVRQVACPARELEPARGLLRALGGRPVVVKPASGTGAGDGVTTGVRSERALGLAAAFAAAHGPRVCVEEQVEGVELRLLFLDGELLDAVRRGAPCVVGDGRATVRTLVARANEARVDGGYRVAQTLLTLDRDAQATLAAQDLSLDSVPAAGRRVRVKTVVNESAAAENWAVTRGLAPGLVDAGARAAAAVGARLAGVDLITPDPGRSLEDAGGVVLEVNTTPGFYLHYHRRGRPCPVARTVLATLLAERERGVEGAAEARLRVVGAKARP
jgi:cyanophycin synthetase